MAVAPEISGETTGLSLDKAIKERIWLIGLRDSNKYTTNFTNKIETRIVFLTGHIADLVTDIVITGKKVEEKND